MDVVMPRACANRIRQVPVEVRDWPVAPVDPVTCAPEVRVFKSCRRVVGQPVVDQLVEPQRVAAWPAEET
jgi:hypothetical protein